MLKVKKKVTNLWQDQIKLETALYQVFLSLNINIGIIWDKGFEISQ